MKIAVFLQNGFEELEAIAPIDILRRVGVEVTIFSLENEKRVISSHNIELIADKIYKNDNLDEYKGIFLVGGPTTNNYFNKVELMNKIVEYKGLKIAICAAPKVYAKLSMLEGIKVTSYYSEKNFLTDHNAIYVDESVVYDNNFLTAQSMHKSIELGLKIVEILMPEKLELLKKQIMY